MTAKRHDRLAELIKDVEALAKRLRADVRRAARQAGLTDNLKRAAAMLRKQAAVVAGQVEKYAHDLRLELAKGQMAKRTASKRRSARAA